MKYNAIFVYIFYAFVHKVIRKNKDLLFLVKFVLKLRKVNFNPNSLNRNWHNTRICLLRLQNLMTNQVWSIYLCIVLLGWPGRLKYINIWISWNFNAKLFIYSQHFNTSCETQTLAFKQWRFVRSQKVIWVRCALWVILVAVMSYIHKFTSGICCIYQDVLQHSFTDCT